MGDDSRLEDAAAGGSGHPLAKRPRTESPTVTRWVQFTKKVKKGAEPNPVEVPESASVGVLLSHVKNRFPRRFEHMDDDDLELYPNRNIVEGTSIGRTVKIADIRGGGTETDPWYVDYGVAPEGTLQDVTVETFGHIDECQQLAGMSGEGGPDVYVGTEKPLKECLDLIHRYLEQADTTTDRVPPTCVIRCARGGKSTLLHLLFQAVKDDNTRNIRPIIISFNGSAAVIRRDGERCDSRLYRHIADALLPRDHALKGMEHANCQGPTLRAYFKGLRDAGTKVLLIIDELNMLLPRPRPRVETPQDDPAVLASQFLKDVLLKERGVYFVFSSHIHGVSIDLREYMEGASQRECAIVELPVADTLWSLRSMSRTCASLTQERAAFYGNLPALVYSAMNSFVKWTPLTEFQKAASKAPPPTDIKPEDILAFLGEVLTGKPALEAGALHRFARLTDRSAEDRLHWLPCYMAPMLRYLGQPLLGQWLEVLNTAETQDGKAWEALVAVAFGLRYWKASLREEQHDFLAGRGNIVGLPLEVLDGPADATSLEQALKNLTPPKSEPCVQLYKPNHSAFVDFDLFAVRRIKGKHELLMVAQMKQGKDITAKAFQGTIGNAKTWWLCGKGKDMEQEANGWVIPAASRVAEFLAPSLHAASPREWLTVPIS